MTDVVRGVVGSPAEDRVAHHRALFAHVGGRGDDLLRFWLDPLAGLPFRLGESLAEAKIPYAFDDATDRLAGQAMAELVALLRRRFAPTEGLELSTLDSRRPLRDETYSPRFNPPGSLELRVSLRAAHLDPYLDCGLLDAWTARGGPGSKLLATVQGLVTRALEAELRTRGEVPYTYLMVLALADLVEQKKDLAKAVSIRGMTWERLEKAVGLACFAAVEAACQAALAPYRRRALPFDLSGTWLRVDSALSPILYVSIKSRALQNDLNPWSLSPEAFPVLDGVYGEVLQRDRTPATLEARMHEAVDRIPEAFAAAALTGLRGEARQRIFAFLAHFDDGRTDWMRLLAAVLRKDADLDALLRGAKARDALRRRLTRLGRARSDPSGSRVVEGLVNLLEAFGAGDPAVRPCPGLPPPEALARQGTVAHLAYALDAFAAARLEETRGHLRSERIPGADPEPLVQAWETGRLYRLAPDGRPLLKALRRPTQGQLFVDLKGFTRRTFRAKEVVMADFMREQFYGPILAAARRRDASLAFGGAGDRPVELHNLLGDAAAFAGSVTDLLALARDLQAVGRAYEDRLRRAAPNVTDESTLGDLEAALAATETETAGRLDTLRGELETARAAVAQLSALDLPAKLKRLEAVFDGRFEELARRRGEARGRLEAGDDPEALGAYLERLDAWELEVREQARRTRETLGRLEPAERDSRLTELLGREESARVRALEAELARVREARATRRRSVEEQRRAATGFGLETGTYISYGASAEVITLDDEVFGSLRVAISEKINEAARGTARSGQIKARLDAELEAARTARGAPELAWPFAVYVESAYGLVLPADLSSRLERALRDTDLAEAEAVSRRLGELTFEDLRRLAGGAGTGGTVLQAFSDIHNLGVALSEAALDAFLGETLASRHHFTRTVPVSGLDPAVTEGLLFREETLPLVVSVPATAEVADAVAGALIFRRAGDVQFRGFELKGATGVYELLVLDRGFGQRLCRHHLPGWIEEAREDPGRLITRLATGR